MPSIPIIMPQLGESIAEATIINFLVKPGDSVAADQDLIEVETNKASLTVASPCRGRVEKFTGQLNESYAVGTVLGQIEATREEAVRLGLDTPAYMHLPVAVNEAGEKLSKQTLAAPVSAQDAPATLWRALEFLRQQPPAELVSCKPEEMLAWAVAHWDRNRLKGIATACSR